MMIDNTREEEISILSGKEASPMIKPYYEEPGITIYHGDCRDILPQLEPVDLVLTDPPYKDFNSDHGKNWKYVDIKTLSLPNIKQLIFWDVINDFPLKWTARHIWHKKNSQSAHRYEYIFELNGGKTFMVFPFGIVSSPITAQFAEDIYYNHPAQKPIRLINRLIETFSSITNTVLDPFMGSGTTLRACKDLGRKGIGIEIEQKYCDIAIERLRQGVLI
jgi:site-specific DNA-methyltransferase (adenine-specific)